MNDNEFRDRAVLVTGGASGIGRATALAFAGRGARIAVSDIAESAAEETARQIRDGGGDAFAVRTDVTDSTEVESTVRAVVERFGRLDIAVNNAGIGGVDAGVDEHSEEAWRQVLDVNLTGVWLSMKHEIPEMTRAGGGVIVNVASVAGLIGFPRHAAYAASKHGVVGLTKSAALEYARRGIRINTVCPGFTRTAMVEQGMLGGDATLEQKLVGRMPLGRLGTPDEIAEAIVYLCSDAAAFMIGHALVLDGGIVAA